MKESEKRLFDYPQMIETIMEEEKINQNTLSEDNNYSAVHVSNIVNNKDISSVEKTLELINKYHLYLEEFVEEGYKTKVEIKYEDKEMFQGLRDEEILFLIECLKGFRKIRLGKQGNSGCTEGAYRKITGENIRRMRKEKEVSEQFMADALGMKKSSYRNLESGSIGTTMDNYITIGKILEVPISTIFRQCLKNQKMIVDYNISEFFRDIDFWEKKHYEKIIPQLVQLMKER